MSKRRNEGILENYINDGYLPEAIDNFLVLLGWSPGDNQEIFSLTELARIFSLNGLQSSPATLQQAKLDWFNGHYIRQLSIADLREKTKGFIPVEWQGDSEKLDSILTLVQERLIKLSDVKEQIAFVFNDFKPEQSSLIPQKRNNSETASVIEKIIKALSDVDWEHDFLEKALREQAEALGWKTGEFFMLIRISVTGSKATPPLFDTMLVLGKETCIKRLRNARKTLE